MSESQANRTLSDQAMARDLHALRVAQWAARNQPRAAHKRPSLFVRILRAIVR